MATSGASKSKKSMRRVKPAQTLREQSADSAQALTKPRRSRKAAGGIGSILVSFGRFVAKLFGPLGFLLLPFRTKIGRLIVRILGAILLINFFRGAFRELRDVKWPDRKQTAQLTFAVFIFAIVFGLIIGITDYGLDKVFKQILLK